MEILILKIGFIHVVLAVLKNVRTYVVDTHYIRWRRLIGDDLYDQSLLFNRYLTFSKPFVVQFTLLVIRLTPRKLHFFFLDKLLFGLYDNPLVKS